MPLSGGHKYLKTKEKAKPLDSQLKILGMTKEVDARLNFRHDKKSGIPQRIKTRLPRQAKNSKANSQREARKPQEDYNLRRDLQSFGGFKRKQKSHRFRQTLAFSFSHLARNFRMDFHSKALSFLSFKQKLFLPSSGLTPQNRWQI